MADPDHSEYFCNSLCRHRRVMSDGSITLAVSPRSSPPRDPRRIFNVSEFVAPQPQDPFSIGREVLQHLLALIRLALQFCSLPLKPAFKIYNSINDVLLLFLDAKARIMPYGSHLLPLRQSSAVGRAWPTLRTIASRTAQLPVQIIQSLIGPQDTTQFPQDPASIDGTVIELDERLDYILTFRVEKSSSGSNGRIWHAQNQLRLSRISMSSRIGDDISFAQNPSPEFVHGESLFDSLRPKSPPHIGPQQRAATNQEHASTRLVLEGSDKGTSFSVCVPAAAKVTPPKARLAHQDYSDPVGLIPESRKRVVTLTPSITELSDSQSISLHRLQHDIQDFQTERSQASHESLSPSSDTSSDRADAESFSPEPLWLPREKIHESLNDVWTLSSLPVRVKSEAERPFQKPVLKAAPTLQLNRLARHQEPPTPSPVTSNFGPSNLQNTSESPPCSYDGSNDYPTRLATCQEGQSHFTNSSHPKHSEQQHDADYCGISHRVTCEACRHRSSPSKRQSSKIPKRTKTGDHSHSHNQHQRPRSFSPNTIYNARHSTGSYDAVARARLQRSKTKGC